MSLRKFPRNSQFLQFCNLKKNHRTQLNKKIATVRRHQSRNLSTTFSRHVSLLQRRQRRCDADAATKAAQVAQRRRHDAVQARRD